MFVVKTPPGGFVHLHTHPYSETFVLLRGRGRWTAGDQVTEAEPDSVIVVPPDTLHGFRNSATSRCSSSPCTSRGTLDQTPSGTRACLTATAPAGPLRGEPPGAAGRGCYQAELSSPERVGRGCSRTTGVA